jgi:hypothetical protein
MEVSFKEGPGVYVYPDAEQGRHERGDMEYGVGGKAVSCHAGWRSCEASASFRLVTMHASFSLSLQPR